jgi:spore maturation protein A
MLNLIWAGMFILGIIVASFTGNIPEVGNGIIDSCKEAVMLSITMLGIISFWSGIMKVAKDAGLVDDVVKLISPIVNWLFPNLSKKSHAKEYISVNMVANILGMGWAATPAGINAMKELAKETGDGKKEYATSEMCTFLVINISSLQLIPVNVIAYRSQYGSANPAAIVGVSIIATLMSTICAIIFCKLMNKKGK